MCVLYLIFLPALFRRIDRCGKRCLHWRLPYFLGLDAPACTDDLHCSGILAAPYLPQSAKSRKQSYHPYELQYTDSDSTLFDGCAYRKYQSCFPSRTGSRTSFTFTAVSASLKGRRKIAGGFPDVNRTSFNSSLSYRWAGQTPFYFSTALPIWRIIFADDSTQTYRYTNDSIYYLLGVRPYAGEKWLTFLQNICYKGTGKYTALDYYLSALLLEKDLDTFVKAVNDLYEIEEELPRHYSEALLIYRDSHPEYPVQITDSTLVKRYITYRERQVGFTSYTEERNRMRREFGDTYWWYFDYQE